MESEMSIDTVTAGRWLIDRCACIMQPVTMREGEKGAMVSDGPMHSHCKSVKTVLSQSESGWMVLKILLTAVH